MIRIILMIMIMIMIITMIMIMILTMIITIIMIEASGNFLGDLAPRRPLRAAGFHRAAPCFHRVSIERVSIVRVSIERVFIVLSGRFAEIEPDVRAQLDARDKEQLRDARRHRHSHVLASGSARTAEGKRVGHVLR